MLISSIICSGKIEFSVRQPVLAATWHTMDEKQQYTVSFDSDGGTEIKEVYTVTNGKQYGKLPIPSKLGYKFLGWYTSKENGEQIQWSDIVNLTRDQTLYARWESDTFYVRFDPQGGYVTEEGKTCFYGRTYKELPDATRSDDIFLGWYTQKGELITESTICNIPGNHTLYARWKSETTSVDLSELTFSFENSREDFSYQKNEKLPLFAYQYIFGDSFYAESLYKQGENWAGNSFGMAVLSVMLYQKDVDIKLEDFKKDADLIRQLNLQDKNTIFNLTVKEFIESLQVMEKGIGIQEAYNANQNQLQSLCMEVEKVQKEKGAPVIIQLLGSQGGHTVVGYALEKNKLQIYDPDYPNTNRNITLEKDDNNNYTGWSYTLKEGYKWSSKESECAIRYLPYDVCKSTWEERNKNITESGNIISINSKNAIIKEKDNSVVALFVDGKIDTRKESVFLMAESSLDVNSQYLYLHVPTGIYTVENLENINSEFSVRIMSENQGSLVNTTSTKVMLELNDEERVNDVFVYQPKDKTYQVEIRSGLKGDHQKISLNGVGNTTDNVYIGQYQGTIEMANTDANIVTIDGIERKTYTLCMENTDGGSVYLQGRHKRYTGNQKIIEGEKVIVRMEPEVGYYLADLLLGGISIGAEDTFVIEKVRSTCRITGIFDIIDVDDIAVSKIPMQQYTGNPIKPNVKVENGDVILRNNIDYQVFYHNNTNIGTGKIVIMGVGQYTEFYYEQDFIIALEEGMKYTKDNIVYRITSCSHTTKSGTVSIVDYIESDEKIILPSSIKIGKYNFKITKIEDSAFQGCLQIKGDIVIGKYVKEIGNNAFFECTYMKKVTIGASVETIGSAAFAMCRNLQKVIISTKKLKKVGEAAFERNKKGRTFKYPKNKKQAYKKMLKKAL